MVDFLKWALTDGQKYAGELGYAPLPASVVKLEMEALNKVGATRRSTRGRWTPTSGGCA